MSKQRKPPADAEADAEFEDREDDAEIAAVLAEADGVEAVFELMHAGEIAADRKRSWAKDLRRQVGKQMRSVARSIAGSARCNEG